MFCHYYTRILTFLFQKPANKFVYLLLFLQRNINYIKLNDILFDVKHTYLQVLYMKKIILITGGQRSGKSTYAEKLALSLSANPIYIATAHVWDEEFKERVKMHKLRRGKEWTNIEEEKYLSKHNIYNKVAIVDCITLWCTNFFFDNRLPNGDIASVEDTLKELQDEFDKFTNQDAVFIFVTNEIGSGGVSDNVLQRRFTDLQGWMNQYVAKCADEVILMVSGIPTKIK